MCYALVLHNCLDIGKIEVNKSRYIDKICNSLYCLLKDFIRLLKCIRHRSPAVNNLKQFIVRNNNKCINTVLKLLNTCYGISHSRLSFKLKRFRNNAHRKNTHILGNLGNNRCRTCTGTAAHSACYKYHICALDSLCKLISALFCCFLTNFRLSAGAKSLGKLLAYLYSRRCLTKCKSLSIGINSDKLHASDVLINHSVNCIIAGSTYTYYYYLSRCFRLISLDF